MDKWRHKRTTMQRYNLTAKMYEMRYAEEQAVKYHAALRNLNMTGSRALDVGCGTGLLFNYVATEAQIVVGIDISCNLLHKAKRSARKFRNVHLVQADADHLPFTSHYFDVVFVFTVLQNMPKPEATLNEIKRNAKSDASIVVTGLKKVFSKEAFQKLLQNVGLHVLSLEATDPLKCHVAVTIQI